MNRLSGSIVKTGGGVDLAFAVVVLASYLATFSGIKEATTIQLVFMIGLGMAYLTVGIYGFGFCARINWLPLDIAYFAVQTILGGMIVFIGRGAGYNALVLLPLAGQAVVLLPQRFSYIVTAILLLVYVSVVYLFSQDWTTVWNGFPTFLAGLIFIIVFTQMAVSEEKARSEVERLVNQLTDANQKLRQHVTEVEELSIARERNRMAREIHDGLGHYLTTIHIQIQAGRALLGRNKSTADELLEKAQNLTQDALVDVRKSVSSLRIEPDGFLPLPALIENLVLQRDGGAIKITYLLKGNPRSLSPQAQLTLYRTAQEGINNSFKHSHAQNLEVDLSYLHPDCVNLVVRDDGVGAESTMLEHSSGFGLLSLRERAGLLDGTLEIHTRPDQGFSLNMVVPG